MTPITSEKVGVRLTVDQALTQALDIRARVTALFAAERPASKDLHWAWELASERGLSTMDWLISLASTLDPSAVAVEPAQLAQEVSPYAHLTPEERLAAKARAIGGGR